MIELTQKQVVLGHCVRFAEPGEPLLVREIHLPADPKRTTIEALLEAAWHYGQNDFQPLDAPSLSVGDLVELPSTILSMIRHYRMASVGFRLISQAEFTGIVNLAKVRAGGQVEIKRPE